MGTRVHEAIQFNEATWMKLYIDMNTKLRKEAKSEFEKDFFTLLNNCVWKNHGKCEKA